MDSMSPNLFPVPRDGFRSDKELVNNVHKGQVNRCTVTRKDFHSYEEIENSHFVHYNVKRQTQSFLSSKIQINLN